jgi:hypothetical protein
MGSAPMPYQSTRDRWQETHQSEPPVEPFLANLENGLVLNWHKQSLSCNGVDYLTCRVGPGPFLLLQDSHPRSCRRLTAIVTDLLYSLVIAVGIDDKIGV